jgi:hypothetical protein
MRKTLSVVLLLALAACASKHQQVASADTAASGTPQQQCHREVVIGSNIPHTVCGPVMSEADRQRNVDALRDSMRSTNSTLMGK